MYWFRSYSGSLLKGPEAGPAKSKQKVLAPPLGASPRLDMPSLRLTRRPAGLPTDSSLRSASVVDGATQIKIKIKIKSNPSSGNLYSLTVAALYSRHFTYRMTVSWQEAAYWY